MLETIPPQKITSEKSPHTGNCYGKTPGTHPRVIDEGPIATLKKICKPGESKSTAMSFPDQKALKPPNVPDLVNFSTCLLCKT